MLADAGCFFSAGDVCVCDNNSSSSSNLRAELKARLGYLAACD